MFNTLNPHYIKLDHRGKVFKEIPVGDEGLFSLSNKEMLWFALIELTNNSVEQNKRTALQPFECHVIH